MSSLNSRHQDPAAPAAKATPKEIMKISTVVSHTVFPLQIWHKVTIFVKPMTYLMMNYLGAVISTFSRPTASRVST
jgi:hypothetical protein